MKIDKEIRDKLCAPMPPEAIKQHPTKTFLATIKAIYIVERLNDIFGIGVWDLEHEIISDEPDYVSVRGRIVVYGPEYKSIVLRTPFQYGGHKKTGKNTEPADGYKSAVTDCQSKCASYLEIGIDVFKGLVNPPKGKKSAAKKEPGKKEKPDIKNPDADASLKQKNLIMDIIEKSHGHLTNAEAGEFVGWYQKGEKLTMQEASNLIENMDAIFDDYLKSLQDIPLV